MEHLQVTAPAGKSAAALQAILLHTFGLREFRGNQIDAINATTQAQDSIVVLPTGAGKSLTFQFPPFTREYAFTVVVCPLIALLKEQVEKCQELGLDAMAWNGDTTDAARSRIISDLGSDEPSIKLLYTTPESLKHPKLREALTEAYNHGTLMSFAIDEAHCVSEWGHDFRPAYLELSSLKVDFPLTPIAALTASCTRRVETSIISVLRLKQPLLVHASFNRPNIQYQVRLKELIGTGSVDDAVQDLVEFLTLHVGESGIIYARLRATCDWLTKHLSDLDLDVGCYHAGKDSMARARVQREWSQGAISVVVATIAFGMGIDRAAVRWVIHWDAPSSLEGFYQVIYASHEDLKSAQSMERGTRTGCVAHVADLCMQPGCRRKKLLAYFGEKREACDASVEEACDYCRDPAAVSKLMRLMDQNQESTSTAARVHAHMQRQGAPGSARPLPQPHALCGAANESGVKNSQQDRPEHARQLDNILNVGSLKKQSHSGTVCPGGAWTSALARHCQQPLLGADSAPAEEAVSVPMGSAGNCNTSTTVVPVTAHCVPRGGFKKLHRPTLLPIHTSSLTPASPLAQPLNSMDPTLCGIHPRNSPSLGDETCTSHISNEPERPVPSGPRVIGLRPLLKRPRSHSFPGTLLSKGLPTPTSSMDAPEISLPAFTKIPVSDSDSGAASTLQEQAQRGMQSQKHACIIEAGRCETLVCPHGGIPCEAAFGGAVQGEVVCRSASGTAVPVRTGMLGRKSGFKVPFRITDN